MGVRAWILVSLACGLAWLVQGRAFLGEPGLGRNLVVRTLPGVPDVQSNLYEVYIPTDSLVYRAYPDVAGAGAPRTQKQIDLQGGAGAGAGAGAVGLQAVAVLRAAGESGVSGELVFTQRAPGAPVSVQGNVTGLAPGLHGLHVHQRGALTEACDDLGPHFLAYYGRHGGPRDAVRHVGDLGNIRAAAEGAPTSVRILDHLVSLAGPRSIVGRALVITQSEDDYGRAGTEESALTGSAGPPVACATIAYLN